MRWVLLILASWILVAAVAGLLIGRAIRTADRRSQTSVGGTEESDVVVDEPAAAGATAAGAGPERAPHGAEPATRPDDATGTHRGHGPAVQDGPPSRVPARRPRARLRAETHRARST